KGNRKCELNCQATGYRFYVRQAEKVIDGTPCDQNGTAICVSGQCKERIQSRDIDSQSRSSLSKANTPKRIWEITMTVDQWNRIEDPDINPHSHDDSEYNLVCVEVRIVDKPRINTAFLQDRKAYPTFLKKTLNQFHARRA
ncbi:hypothetical protein STEG23_036363, partial [Scotinomys teguina]